MTEIKKITSFTNLDAWQASHNLALATYQATKTFPREEQFGISSQLRRAASSAAANIAEGFARYHFKDKVRFYYQARGSVAEVQSFTILAKDLTYISETTCSVLLEQANKAGQLINGMIRSIEQQTQVKSPYGLRVTDYELR